MTDVTVAPENERDAVIAKAVALIRDGHSIRQVADETGISRSSIHRWLLSSVPEAYREAQEAGIVARVADCGDALEDAANHFEVSRARETSRYWLWIAERTLSRFAPKTQISGPGGGPIQIEELELTRRFAYIVETTKRARGEATPIEVEHHPQVEATRTYG
jgi:transposase